MSGAKTAKPIEMSWDVDSGSPKEAYVRWGAQKRHLSNLIEPSMCGGDAALCRITLTTCYYYSATANLQTKRMTMYLIETLLDAAKMTTKLGIIGQPMRLNKCV